MALTANVVGGALVQPTWGNEIRDRTLQVFATPAERDAAWSSPPNGAHCVTIDTYTMWVRRAGVWLPNAGLVQAGAAVSGDKSFTGPGTVQNVATFNLPAVAYASTILVTSSYYVGFATGATTFHAAAAIAGNQLLGKTLAPASSQWLGASLAHGAAVAANTVAAVTVDVALDTGPNGYVNGSATWQRISS